MRDKLHVVKAAAAVGLGCGRDKANGVEGGKVCAGAAVCGRPSGRLFQRGEQRLRDDRGKAQLVGVLEARDHPRGRSVKAHRGHAGAHLPVLLAFCAGKVAKRRPTHRAGQALLYPGKGCSAVVAQQVARLVAQDAARGPHELQERVGRARSQTAGAATLGKNRHTTPSLRDRWGRLVWHSLPEPRRS